MSFHGDSSRRENRTQPGDEPINYYFPNISELRSTCITFLSIKDPHLNHFLSTKIDAKNQELLMNNEENDEYWVEYHLNKTKNYLECSICYRYFDPDKKLAGYINCVHIICMECLIKWVTSDIGNPNCPVCRQNIQWVIASNRVLTEKMKTSIPPNEKPHEQNEIGSVYYYDDKAKTKLEDLLVLTCPYGFKECRKIKIRRFLSNKSKLNMQMKNFSRHINQQHGKYICTLCIHEMNMFPQEIIYYNRNDFVLHMKNRDKVNGTIVKHALCRLCGWYFFDDTKLLKHCKKDHCICYICNSFFTARERDLVPHFRICHSYCDLCCMGFPRNEIVNHIKNEHPSNAEILLSKATTKIVQELLDDSPGFVASRHYLDEIDLILRNSYRSQNQDLLWTNDSLNTLETYLINFPSIDGSSNASAMPPIATNAVTIPKQNYDIDFPLLGPAEQAPQIKESTKEFSTSNISKQTFTTASTIKSDNIKDLSFAGTSAAKKKSIKSLVPKEPQSKKSSVKQNLSAGEDIAKTPFVIIDNNEFPNLEPNRPTTSSQVAITPFHTEQSKITPTGSEVENMATTIQFGWKKRQPNTISATTSIEKKNENYLIKNDSNEFPDLVPQSGITFQIEKLSHMAINDSTEPSFSTSKPIKHSIPERKPGFKCDELSDTSRIHPQKIKESKSLWSEKKPNFPVSSIESKKKNKIKNLKVTEFHGVFRYKAFDDMETRQQELYEYVEGILSSLHKKDMMAEFELLCYNYYQSKLSPIAFYKSLKMYFDINLEEVIYPLIAMLPNIQKQSELYEIHIDHHRRRGVRPKNPPAIPCQNCKQIIMAMDKDIHQCLSI